MTIRGWREWWCVNCESVRGLDVHGRCERCGSDSVVFGEGMEEFFIFYDTFSHQPVQIND